MTGFPQPGRRSRGNRAAGLALAATIGVLAAGARGWAANPMSHTADRNAPIAFQADEVEYDEQHALTIAKGHVEISQANQVLLADEVAYNQRTDTVTASGHVSLLLPSGEVLFAPFMELRDRMNNDFAKDVRMLMADRSRLAANAARRINGNRIELARAVYSPCDLCAKNPSAPPAWQLKAREISDDRQTKTIEFRDATLEIGGFPVFYTPYLSEPEPTVKRASGFLMPSAGSSSNLGLHASIPYFLVLGPDKDLTLDPHFTSKAGEMLAGQYRQRFGNGYLDGVGSLNYSNVSSISSTGSSSHWRGHVNASGVWDLDETYRTGFQLQRVSDQTYLQRFGFGQPLLNAMISRAYLEGFEPRAATDVNAYMFQPLQPGLGDSTQPIVLPVANRTWLSEPDGLGGRWLLNSNLLNIVREVGTQTRRLSLGAQWEKIFRDGIGGEYRFTARLRGDGYSVADLSPKSNPDLPSYFFTPKGRPAIGTDYLTGRVFPQFGLTWRYPLAHPLGDATAIVEPVAGIFAGPSGVNSRRVPNEDSLGFQFNASDLFRPDRLAGYDIIDSGQRVDYGLKLGLYKGGGSYNLLLGQSYRAERNPFMPAGSGAERRLSDVVGRLLLQPNQYLDLIYQFRLDNATLASRSQEIGINAGPPNLRVGANFLLIPAAHSDQAVTNPLTGQNIVFGKREQVSFNVTTRLTQYWSLAGSETINLTDSTNLVNGIPIPQSSNKSLNATVAAIYQDECMAFIGSVSQSGISNGDVRPGVSVMFSVVFKNLGEIGGTVLSVAGSSAPPLTAPGSAVAP